MIDQDKGPATGKINAAAKSLRRMLAATCLSIAAGRGAQASTFLEWSRIALDSSTTLHSADVLPDGTVIVEVPLAASAAIGLAGFSNLACDPPWRATAAAGNAGPGLEAFDGSDLRFTPLFDQEIFAGVSVTVSASVPDGIFPGGVELEEGPIYCMGGDEAQSEGSDSAILMLTGLGFALAGTAGRRPNRNLRRLNALESCQSPGV